MRTFCTAEEEKFVKQGKPTKDTGTWFLELQLLAQRLQDALLADIQAQPEYANMTISNSISALARNFLRK